MGNVAQFDVALLHQVQESARCCDQDIDPARQRLYLGILIHAAEDHRVAKPEMLSVSGHRLADLQRKLARRCQDQR